MCVCVYDFLNCTYVCNVCMLAGLDNEYSRKARIPILSEFSCLCGAVGACVG